MPAPTEDLSTLQPQHALQVLSRYRALVLDSAYRPIDVVNWQRAICMDLLVRPMLFLIFLHQNSAQLKDPFLPRIFSLKLHYDPSI